jgi:hypothetical protein
VPRALNSKFVIMMVRVIVLEKVMGMKTIRVGVWPDEW